MSAEFAADFSRVDARGGAVGPGVAGILGACGGKAVTGGGLVVEVAGLGNFVSLIKAEAESVRFLALFLVLFVHVAGISALAAPVKRAATAAAAKTFCVVC